MAKFEFNERAIADIADQTVTLRAQQMRALLDAIQVSEHGKDIEVVKAMLALSWQQQFDGTLTDPHLSSWAEQLAKGGKVIVTA